MSPSTHRNPALVWVKAQAPGIRHDGSSMVTLRLAESFTQYFDLHLVCLSTDATPADPSEFCCPPFRSVRVVTPDHQGARWRRVVVGGWYLALDALSVRPLADSVESCGAIRRALAEEVTTRHARVVLAEYWTMGRVLRTAPVDVRVLRLIDVEHENLTSRASRASGVRALWLRLHARMVRRAEVRAARGADRLLFVSHEDEEAFRALGVRAGETLPVAVTSREQPGEARSGPPLMVFLGQLGWWPNLDGLRWFVQDVLPEVRRAHPDARLLVVGGGSEGHEAEFADASVELLGFVPDLQEALGRADVAVVPVRGGTGVKTKTLDLLAAGLPLVSTANGVRGTSAVRSGALIAETAEEFATAVISLLDDPERRQTLVAVGQDALLAEHSAEASLRYADALAERIGELP